MRIERAGQRCYGKHRGTVISNEDPLRLGRVKVIVPNIILDDQHSLALPALPYAGDGVGLYLVPPVGAFVWVEFEHGDPDYPIWTGCFWLSRSAVPTEASEPNIKLLKTDTCTVTINDKVGSISIEMPKKDTKSDIKAKIEINAEGEIVISTENGASVKLTGSSVLINEGALEVT